MIGALLLLILQDGELCLFYGDEAAMEGGPDPDNRRPMNWCHNGSAMNMQKVVKSLLILRRRFHGFVGGRHSITATTSTLIKDSWQKDGCMLSAYVHNGNSDISVPMQIKGEILFGNGILEEGRLALPPHGAALTEEII